MAEGIPSSTPSALPESWFERCLDHISAVSRVGDAFAERRSSPRYPASNAGLIRTEFGNPVPCTLVDRSAGGARLKVLSVLGIPDAFTLCIGAERLPARVAWRSPSEIGVAFTDG